MWPAVRQQVLPDDHSKLVPLLPIPNRTVKRLSADDSADSRVKVGHRQALIALNQPSRSIDLLGFFFRLVWKPNLTFVLVFSALDVSDVFSLRIPKSASN